MIVADDADADVASPTEAEDDTSPRRTRVRELFWLGGVSAVALGIALLMYQVWNANLHLPIGYSSDTRLQTTVVKGLGQNGWWIHNPRLGAPFVQDMRDFPAGGQTSQVAVLRVLAGFIHSPGLVINIYFLGGFAVVAAVAYVVFRRLGLSAPVAAGLAIAYDFLPWHYWHGADHLTHSTYFPAPLAVLLLVRVLEPELRFLRDQSARVHRPYFGPNGSVRGRPLAALLVISVVIGCSEEMLATFTVVLMVIVGLIAAIATRRLARLVFALLFASTIVGTFLLANIATLLHVMQVGKNQVTARRFVFESDLYGLRPSFMLLPIQQHWIDPLGSFARKLLMHNTVASEPGQAIGFVGVIGVFTALGMLFTRALRSPGDGKRRSKPLSRVSIACAVIVVLGIILGSGGATFLDAVSGFTQIREWNWVVLIIAFAAFTITGFLCERLLSSLHSRTAGRNLRLAATAGIVVVIAGVGILDGGRPPRPNAKTITDEWVSDQAFVAGMHTMQPPDGAIFEFPVVRFPEYPRIEKMVDYEQFRGYLADKGNFRWSYGAMKGRPEGDWQLKLPAIPTRGDLRALIGLGFTGLWENRDGFPDNGRRFEARLVPLLGRPSLVSPDGHLVFYDLRPFAAKISPNTDLAAEARARYGITAPKRG